jgi:hypothetical protein
MALDEIPENKSFKGLFGLPPAGKIAGYLKPGAAEVFAKTQKYDHRK